MKSHSHTRNQCINLVLFLSTNNKLWMNDEGGPVFHTLSKYSSALLKPIDPSHIEVASNNIFFKSQAQKLLLQIILVQLPRSSKPPQESSV